MQSRTAAPGLLHHRPSLDKHPWPKLIYLIYLITSINLIYLSISSHHITSHLSHHSHWFSSFLFSLRLTLFLIYLESIPLHFLIGLNSDLLAHRSHLPYLSYISFSASISSISSCFPSFSSISSHLSYLFLARIPLSSSILSPHLSPFPSISILVLVLILSYSSFFKYHITWLTWHVSHCLSNLVVGLSFSIKCKSLVLKQKQIETLTDLHTSHRTPPKNQSRSLSLCLCHCLWVSGSLNLWGKSRLCDVWWSVWCDHLCDFFCERKWLDSFSHKPRLRSKILKLETLKQIGQKSGPQSENFAFVIHHSSSGPLAEQIWHSLLEFGGIWEVQVQTALALCPSSGTWDNDLMNCGVALARKKHGKLNEIFSFELRSVWKNAARNTGWLNARQFLANEFLQQNWNWVLIRHGNPGRGSRP